MIHLHPACDEAQVVKKAAAAWVLASIPARPSICKSPAPPSILLGFSGLNSEQIHEGVSRLAGIIPRCRA